jgi:ABC-type transporter Mla subunit MlaD
MADLDEITETLRRQRRDIDDLLERTASRSGDAADLVKKIGDLRQRFADTQARVAADQAKTAPKR